MVYVTKWSIFLTESYVSMWKLICYYDKYVLGISSCGKLKIKSKYFGP